MNLLQIIPSNPFEYGVLGLLALSYIVAIRYLVKKEEIFQKTLAEKELAHAQEIKDKKAEYLQLVDRKEAELRECYNELKTANEQRFEIVRQNIELSMELMSAIEDFKKARNGNSRDK